ncbi:molybdenum cofactor biosynthesis protein MoaE [Chloroflexota bacterium]
MFVEITEMIIASEQVMAKVKRDVHGAVVTFNGVIRDHSEGKKVICVEYEAFKEMAEKKLWEIIREIESRWGLEDVIIIHRVGRMDVGEIAVVIAVASPHRMPAFEACEYAIDRIKQIVPIWKKEVFEQGENWVGPSGQLQ